jgi:hypothetical protein
MRLISYLVNFNVNVNIVNCISSGPFVALGMHWFSQQFCQSLWVQRWFLCSGVSACVCVCVRACVGAGAMLLKSVAHLRC